ncbi:MAG TPA: thioredoxin family protein [Opitutaceae bacterium]|jgi:thiol-disulfide isomerase/thioredoxin
MVIRRIASLLLVLAAVPAASAAGATHEKGAAPLEISHGSRVRLADYLVPGKTTVFDFYSRYCPTCMSLKPGIERLHSARAGVAVVFIDINRPGCKGIDWHSPVSKQYDVPSNGTPLFRVYGPDGKLQAERKPAFRLVTGRLN